MPNKPAAEKTEQPTPRKLNKAKKKGQVPQSKEVHSVVSIVLLLAVLFFMAPNLEQWFMFQLKQGFSGNISMFHGTETFIQFVNEKIISVMIITLPFMITLVIGTVLAGMSVSGINFSTEAVQFKLDTLNPVNGLSKIFNTKSLVKLLLDIGKLTFVSAIVWFYLTSKTDEITKLRWAWTSKLLFAICQLILGLMIRICIALIIIALIDVIYQKWKHIQDLKMTKKEVKDERKETEGSPEVKKRVKSIQFQMAMKRMIQEVPKADVVLVNPTHVAVAMKYDANKMDCPIVVAKGANNIAEKIRQTARAYGVPVIRRPKLARTIYSNVKIGTPIPQQLYIAVAEILAMIYRMKGKRK